MCGGGGLFGTIGSLAGSFFGGPIGGAIGGALGGLLGGKSKSMGGGGTSNAAAEQAKAETDALNKANVQTAMRRKALKDQSLFTGAGDSAAPTNTLGVGG